jgi:predicted MFS family arabinose efflux permease
MSHASAITRNSVGRFALLGALYFAQGLPFGFFVQAIPVILRNTGVSLSAIGFTSLLTLPWALKFLWAPYLDRVYLPRVGRRRTWILAMQLAGMLVLTVLSIVHGGDIRVLMGAMFVLNLIAATQDIATDGFAVELLPPAERGFANGLQVAGYRAGMFVGGSLLLGVYADVGGTDVFAMMAGLTALASLPVLASRESPIDAAEPTSPAIRSDLPLERRANLGPHFLSLPGVWKVLALVVAYKFGEAAAQGMLRPFLVDHHLGLKDIAFVLGRIGFIAGLIGALVGGVLVGLVGHKRALIAFGVGQVITVLGYAYLAYGTPSYRDLCVWAGFEHFASGMATAALFTAMMDWCRPRQSGTDYTVQASAVVIATGISATLGGLSADALGYGGHFLACAVLCMLAIVVVAALFPARFPAVLPAAKSVR